MMENKLIIISGLPGTGKTTLAEALAGKLGIPHINSDILREQWGKKGRYDPESKQFIYRKMQEAVENSLRNRESVVVDATFYKNDLRHPYRQLARVYDIPLKWIELEAVEAVIRERVSRKRAHSEADFSVYQKIKKTYEPVNFPHLVLPSDQMSPDQLLTKVIAYLDEPITT